MEGISSTQPDPVATSKIIANGVNQNSSKAFTRLSSSSRDGKSKTFIFTTLFLPSNNLISVNRHQTEATVFSLIMSFRVLSGLRPTAEDGDEDVLL